MNTIHSLRKNKSPAKAIEQPQSPSIISTAPKQGQRGRLPLKERIIQQNAPPQKILTISQLSQRNQRVAEIVRKAKQADTMSAKQAREQLGPKVFSDYVKNNAWKGRRCFIIGGGPSVKKVNLDLLNNELTIGINRAYELLSPSILFGVDGQMWGWVEQGKCGEESKRKFNEYKGYKAWMAVHDVFPPDFYLIDIDDKGGYRIGTTNLLAYNGNSGYGAINLAAALGANPIYLLGFDMQGDKQGKQKWWHDGYPVDYGENVYKGYIKEISNFAPVLKKAGFDVVNLNPKSALKCFTFGNYKRVVANKPVIPANAIKAMGKPCTITAITPTGDRPLAFALCKHWMEMQTVQPDQWLVIDDGEVPLKPSPGMDYIRRKPTSHDPKHTLNVNLQAALPLIRGSKIIIIEDDEYYAPRYIETLSKKLDSFEVAGISNSKYYHLYSGASARHANTLHASLAQTSFRNSFLPAAAHLLNTKLKHYIDICIWQIALAGGRGYLFLDEPEMLYVGIKGLPGRPGIGVGHKITMYGNSRDTSRALLKKWIPKDYNIYLDVINGELTNKNIDTYFPKITGITVCQNTKDLMERAYESVRKFHPTMPIIIIDGSDPKDPCALYVKSLRSALTTVYSLGKNIGHGRGMCMGIDKARTPYALIFDSDIEMLKSPVDAMFEMMMPDTFGVGYTEKTGFDGYEYGARKHHATEGWMKMLHPYFQLINIANYHKFHPYVHHGAPCYLTALDIHKRGLTSQIIKEFPGLGHSSGKGWTWEGKPREYIRHDPAGTRRARTLKGLGEIEGDWVKK